MTNKPPRTTHPRRWRSLAAASASAGLALAGSAMAAPVSTPAQIAGRNLADTSATSGAVLWKTQATTEGGEGGESGATEGASSEVTYLAQLSLVEGHLMAAAELFRKGMVDEAIGLSYHPEAEMMDAVRAQLAHHNAADITPAMQAFSDALEHPGATQAEVDLALGVVSQQIATATAPEANALRVRFDAMTLLLRAAANEYRDSTETGSVTDVMAWHEAQSFVALARRQAAALGAIAATEVAAAKATEAMLAADAAFGPSEAANDAPLTVADPAILLAVAARVELIASSVR